jgi:pimeloyl-ACP methyl ester carboxylesterase
MIICGPTPPFASGLTTVNCQLTPDLEVRSRLPANRTRKPPLLFVHGGYADAWCWEPFFLPWFAAQGWPAHALSLRGHGASAGADTLFIAGLDDYVADVEHVASQFDAAPVLIGHSMGAAVLERMMATRPVRAAALIAPVPPTGLLPVAARLATTRPDYLSHMIGLDPTRLSQDILKALRPFYFSRDVQPAILREAIAHLSQESPRVLFDLSMRLHWIEPQASSPVFVLGAAADQIAIPADVEATARHHGVQAAILPGMGHMLMLEPEWRAAAKAIAEWVENL